MFRWKLKKRGHDAGERVVGLFANSNRLSMVACESKAETETQILAWDSVDVPDATAIQADLRRFVDAHQLQGLPCRAVLSSDDYSLRLVERPANVPDEELVEATRWLVRDLIEFDIDAAEIAILPLPESSNRARTPRMFVIAARQEVVSDLCEAIVEAGLELDGIDIAETAMVALETHLPDVVAGRAALKIGEKSSALTVSFQDHLYLARSVSIDSEAMETAADQALNGLGTDLESRETLELLDPLLLEVQRSLDYYESENGLAPASRLTLLPSKTDFTPILPVISEALRPVQIEMLDLEREFLIEEAPTSAVQGDVAMAIGGAVTASPLLDDALVPSDFKGTNDSFGLASIAHVAVLMMLFGLGLYGFNASRLDAEAGALAQLENQRSALESELEQRLAEQANDRSRTDPAAKLAALRTLRDLKLRTMRDLKQGGSTSSTPFSAVFESLARQDLEGVWLERIELSQGGDAIRLDGRTLRAEDVPKLLRRLGIEPSFATRKFRNLEIMRRDDSSRGLSFVIATEPTNSNPSRGRP